VIPTIHHLSLANCGCDVINALRCACNASNLRILVLSRNLVSDLPLDFSIPQRLKGIILDEVVFPNPALLLFLFRDLPVHSFLSVCDFTIPSSWDDFFNGSAFPTSTISSLKWDGSPVGLSFFDLLDGFSQLKSLSLSRCFSQESRSLMCRFGHFARECRTLERLTLRGSGTQSLGTHLPELLELLVKSVNLSEFDFTGQCFDRGAQVFKDFIVEQPRLSRITIDGNLRPTELLSFCDWVVQNNISEKISFPDNELWQIAAGKPSAEAKYQELLAKFADSKADTWVIPFTAQQFGDTDWPFWNTRDAMAIRSLPDDEFPTQGSTFPDPQSPPPAQADVSQSPEDAVQKLEEVAQPKAANKPRGPQLPRKMQQPKRSVEIQVETEESQLPRKRVRVKPPEKSPLKRCSSHAVPPKSAAKPRPSKSPRTPRRFQPSNMVVSESGPLVPLQSLDGPGVKFDSPTRNRERSGAISPAKKLLMWPFSDSDDDVLGPFNPSILMRSMKHSRLITPGQIGKSHSCAQTLTLGQFPSQFNLEEVPL
jgi:hypothetical protein